MERKIAEWSAYRTPKRKFVVLSGPEDLEVRIVPADTELWIGPANGVFSQAANWSLGGIPGFRAPINGDVLQFGGTDSNVNGANTSAVDDMASLSVKVMKVCPSYSQTITLNNPLTVSQILDMQSGTTGTIAGKGVGTLSIKGNNPTWTWGGGTISAYTVFSAQGAGGTTTINGTDVTLNNTLINNGTINWSSKNPQQGPGPNINMGALGTLTNNGTFNIQTASTESINGQAGGGSFLNSGTVTKTGANTTTINVGYSQNQGSLTVNSGTLAFQQSFSTSGGMVVLNGGNISSSTQIMTIGTFTTLSGVGTITAAMGLQNSGIVVPGVNGVPGTLTLVGNYTQEAAGALSINIDAVGNFGVFNVQGTATLAGTLGVNKNANYQPPAGTNLVFMTYTSVAGDFGAFDISNNSWTNGGVTVDFVPTRNDTDYELDAAVLV